MIDSEEFTTEAGIRQGSPLAPILLNIYAANRSEPPTKIKIQHFADDTIIWTTGKNINRLVESLQQYIIQYQQWTYDQKITINTNKSELILFHNPPYVHQNIAICIKLNNHTIPQVQTVKYLGVTFDRTLNFQSDINETVKKILRRANLLWQIRGTVDPKTITHTYKTIIRSLIDYRFMFMSPAHRSKIEWIN